MDNYTTGSYSMVLVRDLLTAMGLDLKFSKNIVIGGNGPHERCSTPMVDVSNYDFEPLTEKFVKPEEYFLNKYFEKCLGSDITIISMHIMRRIIDT